MLGKMSSLMEIVDGLKGNNVRNMPTVFKTY